MTTQGVHITGSSLKASVTNDLWSLPREGEENFFVAVCQSLLSHRPLKQCLRNHQLTITGKLRILDRLKNGDKKDKIMSDYKIVARTLQRIAKSENQIRKDSLSMQPTQKRKRTGNENGLKWLEMVRKSWILLQVVSAYKSFFSWDKWATYKRIPLYIYFFFNILSSLFSVAWNRWFRLGCPASQGHPWKN